MINDKKPYLVCFDLGGVLIRLVGGSWAHALAAAGVAHLLPEDLEPLAEVVDETCNQYEVGEIDDQAYEKLIIEALPGATSEDVWRVLDIWLKGLYPDVEKLIDALHANDVATACLSNTNHRHWTTFMEKDASYDALWKIQHPFASHLIGEMKPNAGIYEHFEKAMDVDPKQIIFFDDRENNVLAAWERGWNAYQIDPKLPTVPQMSKILCEAYDLLPEPISAS